MCVREKFLHADIGGDRFSAGVTDYYDKDILGRVRTILYLQMRKYEYLFDRG